MTILLCTSLRPSPRTRTFCNDLVCAAEEFEYYVRGKTGLLLLSAYARSSGADRLWIVNSRFGDPKLIECFDTTGPKPKQLSSLLLNRVMLVRDIRVTHDKKQVRNQGQAGNGKMLHIGSHDKGPDQRGTGQQCRRGRLGLRVADNGEHFSELYSCLLDSLGPLSDQGYDIELTISPCKGCLAELNFIDSRNGAVCGPRIMLRDYRC